MPATLANRAHLSHLVRLGNIWGNPVHICATITPSDDSSSSSAASVTITALPRAEYAALPTTQSPDFDEDIYKAAKDGDFASQLWTGFSHMIEERDEARILGDAYPRDQPLLTSMRAMLDDFDAARPVRIFLSGLHIADEFHCSGDDNNPIAAAAALLNRLSTDDDLGGAAEGEDVTCVRVPVPGGSGAHEVDCSDPVLTRVRFAATAGNEDGGGGGVQEAADLMQRAAVKATGVGVDGQMVRDGQAAGEEMRNAYSWQYDVTAVEAEAGDGEAERAGVRRYGRIAGVAVGAAAVRTKTVLGEMEVEDEAQLRYVSEVLGADVAAMFAAVEWAGGAQGGVKDLSYSRFEEGGGARGGEEKVSVAAQVRWLRNVGRMNFDDNVVVGGVSGMGRRVVRDGVCVEDGEVKEGRMDGDTIVK